MKLVDQMQGHVLPLSLGTYGCRVVQKALEYTEHKDQMRLAEELRGDILSCVRDQNANHVIQKILERVSPTTNVDFIPQAFRNNVYSLAAHCYSCRVLQRIFEHCEESQRRPLIDELLRDAEKLMHDQYGNYVIQWILQNASKPDKEVVIQMAKGKILRFSRHKFASNVVEQLIRAASLEERYSLIEEIMVPVQGEINGETTVGAVIMMKDQYGNYVLQRFLELSEGQQKVRLISFVKPALINMKRFSSGYAKHLSAIERLLDTSITRSNAGTMTNDGSLVGT
jgi:pumilio RNA-binding family